MKNILAALAIGAAFAAQAQVRPMANSAGQTAFSLDQAVAYALANNINIKNAQTDFLSSRARVGEIRAAGLPQVNGSVAYNYNAIVPRSVLESGKGAAALFGGGQPSPVPVGMPLGLGFALPHSLNMGLQLNQLIFSPSYLLGLKASSVYTGLTAKQLDKARIDVKASVTKAYYQAMVGQEQTKLLDYNLARLDTALRATRALHKNGFAEQIDVYRLEVQRNNLESDRENALRQVQLAVSALKFSMGYPIQQQLTITDQLEGAKVELATQPEAFGNYDQRLDLQILNTQEQLAQLDLKNRRAGYLPTLVGFASLGAASAATRFIDMLPPYASFTGADGRVYKASGLAGRYPDVLVRDANDNPVLGPNGQPIKAYQDGYRWYANSVIGLTLNVPIFDGLSKEYQITQARLTLKKVADSRELVKNAIDFEIDRANIAGQNARVRLQTQERNLNLAKEVVRVTRIKYQQGVGSSLEVTNAEVDLRVAQTNYYAALYDALVAKVDADVATGRLTAN